MITWLIFVQYRYLTSSLNIINWSVPCHGIGYNDGIRRSSLIYITRRWYTDRLLVSSTVYYFSLQRNTYLNFPFPQHILMLRSALRKDLLISTGLTVPRPTLLPAVSSLRGSNLTPLSVAPYSVSKMTMSVTEAVIHDHKELEDCYNNIIKAPGTDTAIRWQNQFVWELARHSIGEVFTPPPPLPPDNDYFSSN